MPPHPLTNFEIQKYYQNEHNFNGVYSIKKLPKIKDGTYIVKLDEIKSVGIPWIAFYLNRNNGSPSYNLTYFDRFGIEHIPKEIKKFIWNRIQAHNIIMCGYFWTGFIDFMLKGKSLLDYTNNTKIFSITKRLRSKKYIVLLVLSIKK